MIRKIIGNNLLAWSKFILFISQIKNTKKQDVATTINIQLSAVD